MESTHQVKMKFRRAGDRGHADHGWLNSYHTFSFAEYQDPAHMGFRTLRVINDDTVQAGKGFGTHRHSEMEIISYVIKGALEHKDSMGNGSVIKAGQVQRMTAGTGIAHSEFNPSDDDPVHFLQIWILSGETGLAPSYEELPATATQQPGLTLVGSSAGGEGCVTIHQDARLYFGRMQAGDSLTHTAIPGRGMWLQLIQGELKIAEYILQSGDGISIENVEQLSVIAGSDAEFLLFDLA